MKKTLLICISMFSITTLLYAQTSFQPKATINASTGNNPYVIASGLIDSDAFVDILVGTVSGNTLEWYKNDLGTSGNFLMQTSLTNSLSSITAVAIADLNGDGDNDIIAAAYGNDKLVWFENNGTGGFGTEQVISSSIDGAGTIVVGNIDAGSTPDIAIVAYNTGDTVWFSNNGSGVFSGPNSIASVTGSNPTDMDMADFDGDGDLDVVIANESSTIEIYDNNLIPSGTVSFTKYTNSVDTGNTSLFDVSFADLNEDSVLDIIKSDIGGTGQVAYYTKDASGTATTFTETILTASIARPATATTADFDNDGKNDVLVSNAITTGNDLIWLERTDSSTFVEASPAIDATQKQIYAVTIADFDNDNDLDIATVDYQEHDLNWFENNLNPLNVVENEANNISIYPNPAHNVLNFKGNFIEDLEVSIYNVLGKRIIKRTITDNQS